MSTAAVAVDAYLARLDYSGPRTPDAETLHALHRAHLYAVPFENLDIALGRPISLQPDALFDKIVTRRRGGFCYELNGLFAHLLAALGYRVTLLEARDIGPEGALGPPFDHLTLKVICPAAEAPTPWLADVGWGDSFRSPLRMDVGDALQPDGARAYRLTNDDRAVILHQRERDGRWEAQYRFTLRPRRMAEYAAACLYHQTSPDSSFTRRVIITRATPDGRVTLSDLRLITTHDGARQEEPVSPDEYLDVLRDRFGVTLDASPFDER